MNKRRDAFLAAAKMSPEIYRITERHGGVCTIGSCTTKPGIVTSVVEECRITLDQRHLDAAALARMLQEAKDASERFADGRQRHRLLGAHLADRTDPLPPRSHRALRRSDSRENAAARVRIGCPPARCTTPRKSPAPASRPS